MVHTKPQLKRRDEIYFIYHRKFGYNHSCTLDVVTYRYDGNANILIRYIQQTLRAFPARHNVRAPHVTSKDRSKLKTCTTFYS